MRGTQIIEALVDIIGLFLTWLYYIYVPAGHALKPSIILVDNLKSARVSSKQAAHPTTTATATTHLPLSFTCIILW